jgi:hypothetical protein
MGSWRRALRSLPVLKDDDAREVGGFEATSWNTSQKPGRFYGRASSETLNEKTPVIYRPWRFVSGSRHSRKKRNNSGTASATFARRTVTRARSRVRVSFGAQRTRSHRRRLNGHLNARNHSRGIRLRWPCHTNQVGFSSDKRPISAPALLSARIQRSGIEPVIGSWHAR